MITKGIIRKSLLVFFIFLIFISVGYLLSARGIGGNKQISITIKEDRNLEKGIQLLNDNQYENATHHFEVFLLTNQKIFDSLMAVGAISFGGFHSKLNEGIQYFEKKIKGDHQDYNAFYFMAILRIMGLELNDKASSYLKMAIDSSRDFPKIHYMLGLAYLLQGENKSYETQCLLLEKQDINLANRLRTVLDESPTFRNFLKETFIEKNRK
ncbi:MAG: hypothetical protein ABSB18_01835 [Candidatus Omnitrophota bacterium]